MTLTLLLTLAACDRATDPETDDTGEDAPAYEVVEVPCPLEPYEPTGGLYEVAYEFDARPASWEVRACDDVVVEGEIWCSGALGDDDVYLTDDGLLLLRWSVCDEAVLVEVAYAD